MPTQTRPKLRHWPKTEKELNRACGAVLIALTGVEVHKLYKDEVLLNALTYLRDQCDAALDYLEATKYLEK